MTDQSFPLPDDLEPEDLLPEEVEPESSGVLTPEEDQANRHAEDGHLRDTFFAPNGFVPSESGHSHPEDDEHPSNTTLMPGGLT